MATFSPSPAPRRSNRLRPAGNSPGATRRIRVGSSRPTSRLATPVRAERHPFANDAASVTSGMDVDEGPSERAARGAEAVYAKSEELSVSFYTHLPVEVKQVLKNAGAGLYAGFWWRCG